MQQGTSMSVTSFANELSAKLGVDYDALGSGIRPSALVTEFTKRAGDAGVDTDALSVKATCPNRVDDISRDGGAMSTAETSGEAMRTSIGELIGDSGSSR